MVFRMVRPFWDLMGGGEGTETLHEKTGLVFHLEDFVDESPQ